MNTAAHTLHNSYLLVETDKLRENVRTILKSLPAGTKLIPVIKDDAYGIGALGVARALEGFPELDCFAVAHVSEGLYLRREGLHEDILVMGNALPFQLPAAVDAALTLTVGRLGMAREIAEVCAAQGKCADIHIKIDTGLHRIGVEPGEELAALIEEIRAAGKRLCVKGVFSHFSHACDAAVCAQQYARYNEAVRQLEQGGIPVPLRHISGSESTERFPQYALDAVRVGRRLYMDHPTAPRGDIQEVVSWRSYVTTVKPRHAGDTLGYDGAYRLERDMLVATLGVGYGDGLNEEMARRHVEVLIHGRRCPLLACCMDQCFADVTGLSAAPGDEVTLFGSDGKGGFLSSQAAALQIGANEGCGMTAALSSRVARIYE